MSKEQKAQEQHNYHFDIWNAIFEAQVKLELIHSLLGEVLEHYENDDQSPEYLKYRQTVTKNLLHIVFDGICYSEDMLDKASDLEGGMERAGG